MATSATRPDWQTDQAIERFRARARMALAIGLVGLMLGGMFSSAIAVLMRPLVTAIVALHSTPHP